MLFVFCLLFWVRVFYSDPTNPTVHVGRCRGVADFLVVEFVLTHTFLLKNRIMLFAFCRLLGSDIFYSHLTNLKVMPYRDRFEFRIPVCFQEFAIVDVVTYSLVDL